MPRPTASAAPPLTSIQVQSSTHYACPDLRGYWGDYFGLTQFQNVGYTLDLGFLGSVKDPWLNASTFSVSAFRPPGSPSPCSTATKVYSAPVDVQAFTWPSSIYALPPF